MLDTDWLSGCDHVLRCVVRTSFCWVLLLCCSASCFVIELLCDTFTFGELFCN